jgi:hypothetical protein
MRKKIKNYIPYINIKFNWIIDYFFVVGVLFLVSILIDYIIIFILFMYGENNNNNNRM